MSDASLVVSTLAKPLGIKEEGGKNLLEAVIGSLHGKHPLLLPDQCQQVTEAAIQVHTLLHTYWELKILAISRIPFYFAR